MGHPQRQSFIFLWWALTPYCRGHLPTCIYLHLSWQSIYCKTVRIYETFFNIFTFQFLKIFLLCESTHLYVYMYGIWYHSKYLFYTLLNFIKRHIFRTPSSLTFCWCQLAENNPCLSLLFVKIVFALETFRESCTHFHSKN